MGTRILQDAPFAIRTRTIEEYIAVIKYLGGNPNDSGYDFNSYREETCIDNDLYFGDHNFYKNEKYTIYDSLSDFISGISEKNKCITNRKLLLLCL